MKNAKLLLLSALTLGLSLSLTSCGDDDSSSTSASLVGKWEYAKSGVKAGGKDVLTDYDNTPGCNKDYIEFVEGTTANSGTANDVYYDSDCTAETDSQSYVKKGNSLTVGTGADATTAKIAKLTSTELRLEGTETIQGQTITYVSTFTRAAATK